MIKVEHDKFLPGSNVTRRSQYVRLGSTRVLVTMVTSNSCLNKIEDCTPFQLFTTR